MAPITVQVGEILASQDNIASISLTYMTITVFTDLYTIMRKLNCAIKKIKSQKKTSSLDRIHKTTDVVVAAFSL